MDIITSHVNADFDSLGAMVAAQLLHPDALPVFPGAKDTSVREFLEQTSVCGLEFARIRDIDLSKVKRLILVDVNNPERIGPFAELMQNPAVELHIYDHHPLYSDKITTEFLHVLPVGATVTVMVEQLQQRKIRPDSSQATVMMLGLYEDTGGLLFTSTSCADYAAASFLLEAGADLTMVATYLRRELNADQVDVMHQLLQSREVFNIHGINISLARASIDKYVGDLAVLAHKIRDMENLDVLIIVVRLEDRIFMVGRSRIPEADVSHILSVFGGGGHATAASATVRNMTLVQVMETLPSLLEKTVVPPKRAELLMSTPPRSVGVYQTLKEARTVLTRYNINALAVVDKCDIVGIVTRQLVERAVHLGLQDVPVREYMVAEFGTVNVDSSIEDVQRIIVEKRQRFVPVVEGRRLVGVITRADLLRHMLSGAHDLHGRAPIISGTDGISLDRRRMTRMLEKGLPARVQRLFELLTRTAEELHMQIYAVGGFVRDLLLKIPNLDVDVVIEGDAIEFARALEARCTCRVRAHEKFATAVVVFEDGFKLDLASTRTEYYLEPGALPTVEDASLKLDMYRRDFTINTLALSLNTANYAELLDYFGAQRDLHDRAIRVLHNLSFVEDPTRILRAIRFEQRLGFTLGMQTRQLLASAVQTGFLERVSPLRLFNELRIILSEAAPVAALVRLDELEILREISAHLQLNPVTRRYCEQAGRVVNWFELLYTGEEFSSWMVYFLCLSGDLAETDMVQLCQRLQIPHRWDKILLDELPRARVAFRTLQKEHRSEKLVDSRVAQLLDDLSPEVLLYGMARTEHEQVRLKYSHYIARIRGVKPLLNGWEIQKLGCDPGPLVGEVLQGLRAAHLDGEVKTRADEVAWAQRYLRKAALRGDIPEAVTPGTVER
ncbi:MAG: CBS domain-containing protein [Desulfuromonadaceae bacterium]|nr:CBS domain-containing protein [Desulfuromonadaceae bacterium]